MKIPRLLNEFRQDRAILSYVAYKKQQNICGKQLHKIKKDVFKYLDVKRLTDNKQFWKRLKQCLTYIRLPDKRIKLIENEKVV